MAVIGSMIIRVMVDPSLDAPKMIQIKVSAATIFGTFGLLAQAIYYLVITGIAHRASLILLTLHSDAQQTSVYLFGAFNPSC